MVLTWRTLVSRLDLPRWMIWGRPVKPVSLFFMVSTFLLFVFNVLDKGLLDGSEAGDFLGGMGLLVSGMFFFAWLLNNHRLNEYALVGAGFMWLLRFWIAIFVASSPFTSEGTYFSLIWAGLAFSSFALESADNPEGSPRWIRRPRSS